MTKVERDCLRVLQASAPLPLSVDVVESRPWASALFAGHRFRIRVEAEDSPLDEWLIALPEMELTWLGHFIASAEVVERSANAATIELLAVED